MKKPVNIHDIKPEPNSFEVPEGYFENFMAKLEPRLKEETTATKQVAMPAPRSSRMWIGWVAAASVVAVIVGGIAFNELTQTPAPTVVNITGHGPHLAISDHAIVGLLAERDDEFELTDDELMELVEHEVQKSETTAIINFLEDEGDLDEDVEDEDFLGAI